MPNCSPFNQRDLEVFLYTLHFDGCKNPEEAHEKLLKMTKKECFTLEEVKEHFKKIESKEFSLNPEGVMSIMTLPLLLSCIPNVRKLILERCNFEDRMTLRKVCQGIRESVDLTPMTIQRLSLTKRHGVRDDNGVNLSADNLFNVFYEPLRRGVAVSCKDRAKVVMPERKTMEVARKDLEAILSNKKLKIGELDVSDVEMNLDNGYIPPPILENLSKPMKVRRITTKIRGAEDFEKLLSRLDSRYLEVIKLSSSSINLNINIEKLEGYEQWKNAKSFISKDVILVGRDVPKEFGHLDYMNVLMDNDMNRVGFEELEKLKNMFLLRPTFGKFEIIVSTNHDASDPLFSTVHPPFAPYQIPETPGTYRFEIPNTFEMLTLVISKESILFKGPNMGRDEITQRERQEMRRLSPQIAPRRREDFRPRRGHYRQEVPLHMQMENVPWFGVVRRDDQ